MVRVTELRKVLKDGIPPFKVIAYDGSGNIVDEKEFSDVEEVINFAKEFFGGSFKRVKNDIVGEALATLTLVRGRKGKVEITFKRHYQKSLIDFFG